MMIENPMVIDSLWPSDDYTDHWNEDSTDELIEEYAGDRDMITDAVAYWLDVDGGDVDHLQTVYDSLPSDYKRDLLRTYIEAKDKESDFDEWWEVKFNGDYDDMDNEEYEHIGGRSVWVGKGYWKD